MGVSLPNLLATYSAEGPGHDEMLQAQGGAKAAWDHLAGVAGLTSWPHLSARRDDVVSLLADQGIRSGADFASPWHLDPLPVILDVEEWRALEAGLSQRAAVLDAILADLYGPRRLLLDRVLPEEIVLGHPGFTRAADGIRLPTERQLFYSSTELARNADGAWSAIADVADFPAGLGYAMADRRAITDVFADAYRSLQVHRLGPFFHAFRRRLGLIAPAQHDNPRIAMLVPGDTPPAFDPVYLADTLGVTIVTPADLIVADGRLWLRTLGDAEPVDVILRHMASAESDPVDLTSTATGGVPGLIEAAHSGSVSVVNPIGSGVLENPALLTYLPRVCRHLFGDDLLLPSTVTYWCGERSMGSHVVANLDRLVLISTTTGARVNGWELSISERADLATRISAMPHLWVGQEPVEISTTPTVGADELTPRTTTIHTFCLAEEDSYTVMPGGVGAASVEPGQQHLGDTAKDVWVLSAGSPVASLDGEPPVTTGAIIAAGSGANLFRFGTQMERAEATIRLARESAASVSIEDVSGAISDLSTSAHLVRDHLTPEAWRALAALEQPASLAQHLVNLAALSGVINESVLHDRGWQLLTLGRRLERAHVLLQTLRDFLDSAANAPIPANSDAVTHVLRRHDSLLTFRRRNQFGTALPTLIELLLLEEANPRSLTFCLNSVQRLVNEMPGHAAPGQAPASDLVARLLERVQGISQEHISAEGLLDVLASLHAGVDELADAIRHQQFGALATALWTAEPDESDTIS